MTKRTLIAAAALSLLLGWAEAPHAGKLKVITTTQDLAAIAKSVGGDRVDVSFIAKGYQDPHYVSAKPSFMKKLNKADLLVYTGLQLEIGWLPLLIEGSRNPKVAPGSKGELVTSHGIEILEVPTGEVSRAQGDIHPEGNPHYMLDPRNGLIVAETIAERLAELEPENAAVFERNLKAFRSDLEQRIASWEERAGGLRGRPIVAYHKQWEYLAHWLGLDIRDYIESKPGIPPSPKHVATLIDRIPREGIGVIVIASFVDPKTAEQLGEKTGARVLSLPASVGGVKGVETYADLFETLVTSLERAVDAAPAEGGAE